MLLELSLKNNIEKVKEMEYMDDGSVSLFKKIKL
jgi:hypothetical protein